MKTFYVFWTYIANYGYSQIEARDEEHAAKIIYDGFSDDFRQKGEVYVFDKPPVFLISKGSRYKNGVLQIRT